MSDLMVWVDIETEGLDVQTCQILELGIIVTDLNLNIRCADSWLIGSGRLPFIRDLKVLEMHTKSGLLSEVKMRGQPWSEVQKKALRFLMLADVKRGEEPMCGSTVEFDKKFLERYMPELNEYFHYRTINVSTLKELARKWGLPMRPPLEDKAHRPLLDLANSIAELKFYREVLFK